ncbi:MAG: phosphoribosylaminoimidazolesuccinocarboxamide synthase [Ferrovum myxofaciens]|uniref:phosphoribosylaminoimidazolesuccinocarboxamide synthase n=1 Tax=Ferrovum myxofaciens TaxID=416213 RepID=UPI002355035A|nr:phosphoribosylaminoimidazolesuccinocarboxamide synthase [Ferrovum myxofaciens]QKE41140.1 MAG: phosphoribosylaminoimidazolesuccinocarboxamide synthase [Ferrovum myxofaciens]
MSDAVFETTITSLPLIARGKVRDIYSVGTQYLLMVTTDRLSAFDVVLPSPIPGKGKLLQTLSNFWFDHFKDIPNHLTGIDPEDVVTEAERDQVRDRAMIVKRLKPLPLEAVVRGYLEGSGWKDYQMTGRVCGLPLPVGLQRAEKLPQPIFTPATKATAGDHDENINFERMIALVGEPRAEEVKRTAFKLYSEAAQYAEDRGILIADTKFEFGLDDHDQLTLMDEVLTPDSSRFWPKDSYQPGTSPQSFDKQFVRNWLETQHWNKCPPAPALPEEIILGTLKRYQEAVTALTHA